MFLRFNVCYCNSKCNIYREIEEIQVPRVCQELRELQEPLGQLEGLEVLD